MPKEPRQKAKRQTTNAKTHLNVKTQQKCSSKNAPAALALALALALAHSNNVPQQHSSKIAETKTL